MIRKNRSGFRILIYLITDIKLIRFYKNKKPGTNPGFGFLKILCTYVCISQEALVFRWHWILSFLLSGFLEFFQFLYKTTSLLYAEEEIIGIFLGNKGKYVAKF
jgi:hypothetical protein